MAIDYDDLGSSIWKYLAIQYIKEWDSEVLNKIKFPSPNRSSNFPLDEILGPEMSLMDKIEKYEKIQKDIKEYLLTNYALFVNEFEGDGISIEAWEKKKDSQQLHPNWGYNSPYKSFIIKVDKIQFESNQIPIPSNLEEARKYTLGIMQGLQNGVEEGKLSEMYSPMKIATHGHSIY